MTDRPDISVLLPVYNGAAYLQQTLVAVTAQRFSGSMEVIVVDDGSTDNSATLLDAWKVKQTFPVTIVRHETNYGVCAALALATREAKGHYLAQLGHDDVWPALHLQQLFDALQATPQAVAAFSPVEYIDGQGKPTAGINFQHSLLNSHDRAGLFTELMSRNFLCASASLIRAEAFAAEFWGANNEMLQDYEAWMHLSLRGDFVLAKGEAVQYRLHDSNLSGGAISPTQHRFERVSALRRALFSAACAQLVKEKGQGFVVDVQGALAALAARVHGVATLRMQWLDACALQLGQSPWLDAYRAAAAWRLGMGVKYAMLRKQADMPLIADADKPAFAVMGAADGAALQAHGWVQTSADKADFLLVDAATRAHHTQDAQMQRMAQQKRLILVDAEHAGVLPEGYGFTVEGVSDRDMLRFWRFAEGQGLLNEATTPAQSSLLLNVLRKSYALLGRFIPAAQRERMVAAARRKFTKRQ